MTVVSFRDGSLVVPARFTTSDGSVEDGVTRIDRRHPLYDGWRSYCERNRALVDMHSSEAAHILGLGPMTKDGDS